MKTPLLIDVPKTHPSRHDRIQAFKKQHRIWTHDAGKTFPGRWMAIGLNQCWEAVGGYCTDGITKDSPDDDLAFDLIASACRLIDEADLEACADSEVQAIRELCLKLNIHCPL